MELEKLPIYVSDLTIRAAKKKGGEESDGKVLVVSAVIQPFAKEVADRIITKAASKLFGRDGAPSEDFKKADVFLSGNGHYHLAEFYRSPDNQRPKVATNDVKLSATLAVRRDKETPDLVATLKFDFPFFGEDDAKSFLWLANAVHTQVWLSLAETNRSLLDAAEGGE